jgi:NhaP-type Na+/H+ or K+/H+ antiporter
MPNQEIILAISATLFGLVIGFLAGYAVRSYISHRRHFRTWERRSGST